MSPVPDLPAIGFATTDAWAQWLAANHDTSPGLWLEIAKKGSGTPSVTYDQALDEALCWGWIDGQKAPLDADRWLQRFTRRKPRSKWSKRNCAKVAELSAAGRMQPPGQREVDAAKADGRWEAAYEGQAKATVPDDLQAALDADPVAAAAFAALNGANRYAILYRVQEAKKPETRARRIDKFVAMLRDGGLIHP